MLMTSECDPSVSVPGCENYLNEVEVQGCVCVFLGKGPCYQALCVK